MTDELPIETMSIENRSDFAQWAIERSRAIVAARDMSDDKIAETASALGQAIVDALLEVFDGLVPEV